jgi:hypothetical protein
VYSDNICHSPELATNIKATTVKLLVSFLADYLGQRIVVGNHYSELRATCFWSASEFMALCDKCDVVLSTAQICRLEYLGRLHSLTYISLHNIRLGTLLYGLRPKHHYWEELIIQTKELKLNPKHLGCWGEESLLGRIKRVAQRCHGATMLATSMRRYMLVLSQRWEARRTSGRWFLGA